MSEHETTEDTNPLDPLVGKTLAGRFVLKRLLSRGGMGKVYLATQKPLDREVALKVLDVMDDKGEFRRRFFMEASLCAKLRHPHTVRVYDYGATDDGIFFMVMEYLEGQSLHQMLRSEAPIDPLRAMTIARRVCAALAEAHDSGIIHRDLKPANIFLVHHGDDPEYPKVIDFGLVKELGKESELSRTGHVLGSPLYMSPEQVQGHDVDVRTDVYSIGSILYYALTGQTAVKRGNPMMVLMAQVKREAPAFADVCPDRTFPPVIEWTVRTALQKSPGERFATMRQLVRALQVCERVLAGELPESVALDLVDGCVVLPPGIDFGEDITRPPGYVQRRSSLPPPTPLPGASPMPTDPTLAPSGVQSAVAALGPAESTRTQAVPWVVGTMAALGMGAVVATLVVVVGVLVWQMQKSEPVAPVPVAVDVAPAAVPVVLSTEPSEAEVFLDGVLIGTTPLTRQVRPGEVLTVEVRAEGHGSRTVRLDADQPALQVKLTPTPVPRSTAAPTPKPALDPEPPTRDDAESQPAEKSGRNVSDIRDPWAD